MIDWMDDAACRGLPTEWFISEKRSEVRTAAVRTCQACPVSAECEEFGRSTGSYGLWGGKFLRGRSVNYHLIGCGTAAAYRRHLRNGEKPCQACTEASRRDHEVRL